MTESLGHFKKNYLQSYSQVIFVTIALLQCELLKQLNIVETVLYKSFNHLSKNAIK